MSEQTTLLFSYQLPLIRGGTFILNVEIGQTIFVLGSNGSGKSGFLQHLHRAATGVNIEWIRAHRTSSLAASHLGTTFGNFAGEIRSNAHYLRRDDARYRHYSSEFYGTKALMALVQARYASALAVREAARNDDSYDSVKQSANDDIVDHLNSIFLQSNIRLVINIGPNDDLIATRGGVSYGVDQMSDGERNAFLLAAVVLSAPPRTLFLIDEPETHLHHSISSPLLSTLFEFRSDCSFVVAVHQITLPMESPESLVLLLRDCVYDGPMAIGWDFDLIESTQSIPEDIRAAILGARKTMVFVEGEPSSLDYRLYASILPGVSVIPVGSCQSVINAVDSIHQIPGYHHMECFGVIDRDHRPSDELDELRTRRVFAVDGYSIESIYYGERMQEMVAEHIAGSDRDQLLADAKRGALAALAENEKTICEAAVRARIRYIAEGEIRKLKKKKLAEVDNVRVSVRSEWDRETKMFRDALEEGNLDTLIRQYSAKRSAALHQIATAFGLTRKAYERAVVTLLQKDEAVRDQVRKRFADLLAAIE